MSARRTAMVGILLVTAMALGIVVGYLVADEGTAEERPSRSTELALTISRDEFVNLVQICAAVANGNVPFAPETPIATPPPATQDGLQTILALCRGQR